jgi:hypothetical protein
MIKAELGLEKFGIASQICTDFLTIEMKKDAHPMTGVIKATFKNGSNPVK